MPSIENLTRFDWFIICYGILLLVLHFWFLIARWQGKAVHAVQRLDRNRRILLLATELLPVLGLIGTVWALYNTLRSFGGVTGGNQLDLSAFISSFSPALTSTLCALVLLFVNLSFNACLAWLAPVSAKPEE